MIVDSKVSIITGAASGIGEATAKLYADHSAKVVAADVDEAGGQATVEEIRDNGGEATFVETDVSEAADVAHMMESAVETYGSVDVLCNNAGTEGEFAEVAEYDEAAFEQVLNVNLTGAFLGTKYGVQAMLETGGGAIVNTSSIASEVGMPGQSGYAATKAAINSLTRTTAIEYAERNIRANAVLPGIVETAMAARAAEKDRPDVADIDVSEAMPGYGQPEDIAAAVLFLGSDLASRITGVALPVDGGFLAKP